MFDLNEPLFENRIWRHGLSFEAEFTDGHGFMGDDWPPGVEPNRRVSMCTWRTTLVCRPPMRAYVISKRLLIMHAHEDNVAVIAMPNSNDTYSKTIAAPQIQVPTATFGIVHVLSGTTVPLF